MRYLIDGYNLMYAGGLLGPKHRTSEFRRVRTRFLNDLAEALGPIDAHQTTVVFDASDAPEDAVTESVHKGLRVVYARDDEDADARIERLIAAHPQPRSLTVVSSDNRLRQAATRRRCTSTTADDFWVALDDRKERRNASSTTPKPPPPERPARVTEEESAYWLREFGDLENLPEAREALNDLRPMLTDEEIRRLEREIEREGM